METIDAPALTREPEYSLYTAAYVLTQNADRDIIENGGIVVTNGRICCVGHADMLETMYPQARRTALGNAVLLPGFINGHTHVPMSLLRGFSDDKELMAWLTQDIFPQEAKLTPELVELGALFSMAEMVRTGTTAFNDMYMHSRAVARAAARIGLRAVVGENITQFFPNLAFRDMEAYEELIRSLADEWADNPRIRVAVAPHAPYTTNPELLQRCRALATETGSRFHMHLAETQSETDICLKTFGKRPVPYCADLGLLQPDAVFAHMVHADEHDIELLAAAGCAVVHNPASNMKLSSGVSPVEKMLAAGVPVALGTDGPSSNNAQNMVREMYVGSLLHKSASAAPTAAPAQMMLDMATRHGAAAIGDPFVGTLEPGTRADFIALSLDAPNMQPAHNIVSNLVYAATGHETILTVVGGTELYRDGKFLTCDYEALRQELQSVKAWVKA